MAEPVSHGKHQRFAGCGDEEIHSRYQYQLNVQKPDRVPEMAPFLFVERIWQ
ncbi:TPA: hypothetical protein J4O57_001677 [Escherichia coli]|nr:hypothetical protein [Escherichia coli]HBA5794699.1 hypothetical protein [Escherichia coli]